MVLFILLLEVSTGRGCLRSERDAELLAVIERHSVLSVALVQPEKVLVVQSALGCDRRCLCRQSLLGLCLLHGSCLVRSG